MMSESAKIENDSAISDFVPSDDTSVSWTVVDSAVSPQPAEGTADLSLTNAAAENGVAHAEEGTESKKILQANELKDKPATSEELQLESELASLTNDPDYLTSPSDLQISWEDFEVVDEFDENEVSHDKEEKKAVEKKTPTQPGNRNRIISPSSHRSSRRSRSDKEDSSRYSSRKHISSSRESTRKDSSRRSRSSSHKDKASANKSAGRKESKDYKKPAEKKRSDVRKDEKSPTKVTDEADPGKKESHKKPTTVAEVKVSPQKTESEKRKEVDNDDSADKDGKDEATSVEPEKGTRQREGEKDEVAEPKDEVSKVEPVKETIERENQEKKAAEVAEEKTSVNDDVLDIAVSADDKLIDDADAATASEGSAICADEKVKVAEKKSQNSADKKSESKTSRDSKSSLRKEESRKREVPTSKVEQRRKGHSHYNSSQSHSSRGKPTESTFHRDSKGAGKKSVSTSAGAKKGHGVEDSIVADIKSEITRSPSVKKTSGMNEQPVEDLKKSEKEKIATGSSSKTEVKGNGEFSQPLVPKRTEALPEISAYVESLIGLEYDVQKYTCFYCNPCHGFITTTAQWEEHIGSPKHRKNVCRWRQCLDLATECDSARGKAETAVRQKDVDKYSDNVVVGADHVVEVCDVKGIPGSWVCILCNAVCNSLELLLGHLTSFLHIDNHMERVEPSMYRPPCKEDNILDNVRQVSAKIEHQVLEQARGHMDKKGCGKMRRYVGEKFADWPEEQSENEELMEEQVVMDKMEQLFVEDELPSDYPLNYKIIPTSRSVANSEYTQMTVDSSNTMIGMQYMMEIWAPSRRIIPVYYCTLCDYLVTSWTTHCTILKHCATYLKKNYKSVYECVLLESGSEEEFRRALTLAREKVLLLEGRQARVCHVVQLLGLPSDVFVAVNARIAKRISDRENLLIPVPPRAKKRVAMGAVSNEEQAKQRKTESDSSKKDVNKEEEKKPSPTAEQKKPEKEKEKDRSDTSKMTSSKEDTSKKVSSSRNGTTKDTEKTRKESKGGQWKRLEKSSTKSEKKDEKTNGEKKNGPQRKQTQKTSGEKSKVESDKEKKGVKISGDKKTSGAQRKEEKGTEDRKKAGSEKARNEAGRDQERTSGKKREETKESARGTVRRSGDQSSAKRDSSKTGTRDRNRDEKNGTGKSEARRDEQTQRSSMGDKRHGPERKRGLDQGHDRQRQRSPAVQQTSEPKRRRTETTDSDAWRTKKKTEYGLEGDGRRPNATPRNKPPPLIAPGSQLLVRPSRAEEKDTSGTRERASARRPLLDTDGRRVREESYSDGKRHGGGSGRYEEQRKSHQSSLLAAPPSHADISRSLSREDLRGLESYLRMMDPRVMAERSCLCHSDVEMLRYRMGPDVIDALIQVIRAQPIKGHM